MPVYCWSSEASCRAYKGGPQLRVVLEGANRSPTKILKGRRVVRATPCLRAAVGKWGYFSGSRERRDQDRGRQPVTWVPLLAPSAPSTTSSHPNARGLACRRLYVAEKALVVASRLKEGGAVPSRRAPGSAPRQSEALAHREALGIGHAGRSGSAWGRMLAPRTWAAPRGFWALAGMAVGVLGQGCHPSATSS